MTSLSAHSTLSSLGAETNRLFDQVGRIGTLPGAPAGWPTALFAAEAEKFKLWAVNLGLFVPGHGSLDYRVRGAESLQGALRRFLSDLNDALLDAVEYSTERKQPAEDTINRTDDMDEFERSLIIDSSGNPTQTFEAEVNLLLGDIKDVIQRLYKLATLIRNPSSRMGSSKALRYQKIDPESGVDLLSVFSAFDYDYVRSLFLQYRKSKALKECSPSPPSDSTADSSEINADHVWEPVKSVLCQQDEEIANQTESFLIARIARANFRRRQQFAYWARHRSKLDQHASGFMEPTRTDAHCHSELQAPQMVEPQASQAFESQVPQVHSVTTASYLNPIAVRDTSNLSTISVSEYVPSSWQLDNEMIGFPAPPKSRSEERFFECSLCFTLCSTKILSKAAWEAHLIHDLQPYICTYEDCKDPDQRYERREDWINHEMSHFKVWRCQDHPAETFHRAERYKQHLTDEHANSSEEKLDAMVSIAESSLVSDDQGCPICLLCLESATVLRKHIALHLERFSLFSLPRALDQMDDDGDADSQDVQAAVEETRDDLLPNQAGFDTEEVTQMLDRISMELIINPRAAADNGAEAMIRLLVELGPDVNAVVGQYGTVLHAAAYGGAKDIVRLLIAYGADVNAVAGQFGTALQAAAYGGVEDILRLLIAGGANVNAVAGQYGTALQAAAYRGVEDIVRLLIEHGADINAAAGEHGTALQAAAYSGAEDIVRLLVEHGADVNAATWEHGTALQAAAYRGGKDIVRLLIEHGADVNKVAGQYGTALQAAAYYGPADLVRLLIEHGADVNKVAGQYGTALQAAAYYGPADLVRLLIEHGADVDEVAGQYGTALQAAAYRGAEDIVAVLVEHGADITAAAGLYGTALQAGSDSGFSDGLEDNSDVDSR